MNRISTLVAGDDASISKACPRCVFGKAMMSRILIDAGHPRDHAIDAERNAALRGCAVLQRVEQEAEFLALIEISAQQESDHVPRRGRTRPENCLCG